VAAYLYGKGANLSQTALRRRTIRGLALAVAGAGLALALFHTPGAEPHWLPYTPEAFENRLGKKNLVVDFTADWCPTCKFLERTVLTPPRLAQWAQSHDTEFIQVDLTNQIPGPWTFCAAGKRLHSGGGLLPRRNRLRPAAGHAGPVHRQAVHQALNQAFGPFASPDDRH